MEDQARFLPPAGTLLPRLKRAANGCFYVSGADWVGVPIAPISEIVIDLLPSWARFDENMVQIGKYVLRRTHVRDPVYGDHYWIKMGEGEFYWLRWRLCYFLASLASKIRKTIRIGRMWP